MRKTVDLPSNAVYAKGDHSSVSDRPDTRSPHRGITLRGSLADQAQKEYAMAPQHPASALRDAPSIGVDIRTLTQIAEMLPIEELQHAIWGYDKPYPARLLLVIAETGGQVLGAYWQGRMIGFSFMLYARGRHGEGPYFHSQLVGVLPEYRDKNVGFLMKRAQRQYALDLGIDKIEWTFDPLQGRNGYFNVRKLGTVIRRYHPDYYGQLDSAFTHAISSDRCFAEWFVLTPRVEARMAAREPGLTLEVALRPPYVSVTRVEHPASAPPHLVEYRLGLEAEYLVVEVPADFQPIMADMPLAEEWRARTRDIFLHYLNQRGYVVSDCVSGIADGRRRNLYVLRASAAVSRG
jgi:predicted GNAT superfamily acetyltransferase